jgi:ABC-type molybdate transport system substrate-binding protein
VIPLRLFSGLAVQAPIERVVLPLFREQYGAEVETTFEPTRVLVEFLRNGAQPDVVIAVRETIAELSNQRLLDAASAEDLARVGLGLAVPAGAPVPQIGDLPAFVDLLLRARSVAYSHAGASGIYFSGLLDRLGISDRVNSKATVIPKGYTGECLLDGRADVAIQQLSELRSVPGIEVIGPFPSEVQVYTTFTAANGAGVRDAGRGRLLGGLRALLSGPEARQAYVEGGLETDLAS